MPKEMERKLRAEAQKKFAHIKDPEAKQKRMDAYVYGTMREMGWKPKREKQ